MVSRYKSGSEEQERNHQLNRRLPMKYKGRHVGTISAYDVNHTFKRVFGVHCDIAGVITSADIRKQVWEHDGAYGIENAEQRDKRVSESVKPNTTII